MTAEPTSSVTGALRDLADAEFAALVTVETAERLAARAHRAIVAGDLEEAKRLLVALTDETTIRTCTAVKSQDVSDAISDKAAQTVRAIMDAKAPEPADSDDENAAEHVARIRAQEPQYGFIGRPDRPGGV